MEAMKRSTALALGLGTYFTGRPCVHWHVDKRRSCSGVCIRCEAEMGRRSDIQEKSRQRVKAWTRAHPERARARSKTWKAQNQDLSRAYRRRWREAHPEVLKALTKRRRQDPLDRRAWEAQRRANKLTATPPWSDKHAIRKFYRGCPEGFQVDHVVPLQHNGVCGLHVLWNLQYLPAPDNARKRNHFSVGAQ